MEYTAGNVEVASSELGDNPWLNPFAEQWKSLKA
jgi:hypothetical protein